MKVKLLLLTIALTAFSTEVFAWGKLGHKTIAEIAERHLTPQAKAEISRYTHGTPLAEYATFMDEVRRQPEYADALNGWHASIATPDCKSPVEVRQTYRSCRDGVTAMEQFREMLRPEKREKLSDSTVLCAIKCIVHIVGDFHCPSHVRYTDCKNDGKAKVTLFGKATDLHKVWDSGLISNAHKGWKPQRYATELDTYSPAKIKKCTRGWAQEWFEDGAKDVRESIRWVSDGDNLDEKFQAKALPLAELQLRKAGYQLAAALNTIFGE